MADLFNRIVAAKRITSLILIFLSLNFFILPAFSISPEIQKKQAQAEEIAEQLKQLHIEQEAAVEKYTKARLELGETEEKLRANERKLEDAKVELENSQRVLNGRVRQIYEQGEVNFIDIIFSSASFLELVNNFNFYRLIAKHDAHIIKGVKSARLKLEVARENLEAAGQKQLQATNQLADQKYAIEEKQKQKQQLLDKVKNQIAYLRQQEEEHNRRIREEALRKLQQNRQETYKGLPSTTSDVVTLAQKYLGTPYVWGGEDPSGFDCSGFTFFIYGQFGVYLPRVANDQMNYLYGKGRGVDRSNLQPGDLVFYGSSGYSTHVAIYMGQGYVISASGGQYTGGEVKIALIDYRSDYIGAGRP